jgi:N-acyl homoserine lactone hydrolase
MEATMTPEYSIWALEFAQLPGYPDSALLYGVTEGSRMLPFVYWVLRSEDHVVLVDCGWNENQYCQDMIELYGIQGFTLPQTILARVGLTPEDVDTILVTHHHFDHVSGVRYFPNATVYIQRRDVANWFDKWGAPTRQRWLVNGLDPDTADDLAAVGGEGRLRLVEGVHDVLPGIQLRPAFDTHTAGSQYIVVQSGDEGPPWVFTGDAANVYDNIGGPDGTGPMHPVGLAQGSQECCIRVADEMLTTAGDDIGRVIPSHEVRLWDRFPSEAYEDGLHVAEIVLAAGVPSRLRTPAAG